MARYIDKELLLQDISESVVFTVRDAKTSPELRGARKILDRIEVAPTADVVEVVRCKDCEFAIPDESSPYFCIFINQPCASNDFCSRGIRKEQKE